MLKRVAFSGWRVTPPESWRSRLALGARTRSRAEAPLSTWRLRKGRLQVSSCRSLVGVAVGDRQVGMCRLKKMSLGRGQPPLALPTTDTLTTRSLGQWRAGG